MKYAVKVLIVAGLAFTVACGRNDDFGPTPTLEWQSGERILVGDSASNRTIFNLKVTFTDGDGDVGSADENTNDTCDLKNYNAFLSQYDLLIYYFERVNGRYVEIPPADSCLPFHNILPNLTPTGQNKTLEGEINTPFEYSNFPVNNTDSVKFDLLLRDRAGNESSRISSPAIAL